MCFVKVCFSVVVTPYNKTRSVYSCVAFIAFVAFKSSDALWALWSCVSCIAFRALDSLYALRPCRPLWAFYTLRALYALFASVTFFAFIAFFSLWALRPRSALDLVNLFLQIASAFLQVSCHIGNRCFSLRLFTVYCVCKSVVLACYEFCKVIKYFLVL